MRSARVAEWILSQVLPPDRAVSTVGDWMEDAGERGPVWFWSCVFRTVFSRIWSDFVESPGFMVGLALRGWLYGLWLVVGTFFGLFVGICILVGVAMLVGFLVHQLNWHPPRMFHPLPQILSALLGAGLDRLVPVSGGPVDSPSRARKRVGGWNIGVRDATDRLILTSTHRDAFLGYRDQSVHSEPSR